MPYTNDGYTKFIYPLKLHEDLAAGRPTVGTPIRSLVDFADVIAFPRTFDEWSAAIAEGLSPAANTPERCAARRAGARRFDWDDVVCSIARTIAERLGVDLAGVHPRLALWITRQTRLPDIQALGRAGEVPLRYPATRCGVPQRRRRVP